MFEKMGTVMRIGIVVNDTLAVDGFWRGKRERGQVCYDNAVVWDNETVDFLDDNADHDDNDGDVKSNAGGSTNGLMRMSLK